MGKHVRYVENIFLTPLNEDLFVGYFIYPVLYKHPTKKVSYRKIPHRLKHFYIYINTHIDFNYINSIFLIMFLSNIYLSFDFISKLILVSLYVRVYTVVELLPYFKIRFKVWLFIRYMQIEKATLFERASFVLRYWIHAERIK